MHFKEKYVSWPEKSYGNISESFYLLSEKLSFLKSPGIWPEKPDHVIARETHMSWVFMTGIYTWKLKKPIKLNSILDFSTLEKREYCCREELRLNRRLAPDIYLDVVPLVRDIQGRFSIGGAGEIRGEIVDWLVRMKQLPADATLQVRLENGSLDEQDIKAVAATLIRFFETAERAEIMPQEYINRFKETIDYNFSRLFEMDYDVQKTRTMRAIQTRQSAFLEHGKAFLTKRVQDGKIIEGHGDLRPEHIYLVKPEPVIIDCIEFNRTLRLVDMADELSFLQMMCTSFGNEDAGRLIFDIYRRETGDCPSAALIAFYAGFRAVTRARLALRHMQDVPDADPVKWNRKLQQFLDLAQMYGNRQEESL